MVRRGEKWPIWLRNSCIIVLNHVTRVINVRKVKGVPKILSPTVCHISLGAFQIRAATRSVNKSRLHLIEWNWEEQVEREIVQLRIGATIRSHDFLKFNVTSFIVIVSSTVVIFINSFKWISEYYYSFGWLICLFG